MLEVRTLGACQYDSPLAALERDGGRAFEFLEDEARVRFDVTTRPREGTAELSFERAGPRRCLFFDPPKTRAAILTAGGLCPGLNDVIRALVLELHYWYGVRDILGVRYGFDGLSAAPIIPPQPLTLQDVSRIHLDGGTILGSSRGRQRETEMVDTLVRLEINILFCIGGDGTIKGAHAIALEIERRGLPIAVVLIPKTIDNDIDLIFRSFGFQTAVEEATRVLTSAHIEATGAPSGVGLVKLMGRESGAIAAHATIASGDVNYCLVPELSIPLHGEQGLLEHLRQRLRRRRHAVIAVAEGAGRELIGESGERDASGNVLFNDIGLYLKDTITRAFREWGEEVNIKYFDPSYMIRSIPANSNDSIFCADLARYAVQAAMAGKTDMMIGLWHGVFTHVPLPAVVGRRKRVDPHGNLWRSVLATTGQPWHWGQTAAVRKFEIRSTKSETNSNDEISNRDLRLG